MESTECVSVQEIVAESFFSERNLRYLKELERDIQAGKAHFAEHELLLEEET